MTEYGSCFRCGCETGTYDKTQERWDCGCERIKAAIAKTVIAPKYAKLLRTGRWVLIEKTDGDGVNIPVGVRRRSTGEERWF